MQGTVKFFNEAKRLGFIRATDSLEDLFVNASGLIDKIRQHDKAGFGQQTGAKGPIAVKGPDNAGNPARPLIRLFN